MKTFWKLSLIVPFIFLMTACDQQVVTPRDAGDSTTTADAASTPSNIAEENTNQANANFTPVPFNPMVDIATFPIDLEPAYLDHAKLLNKNWNTLSSDEQLAIVQDIKDAWQQEMGDLNPGTMKLNGENINKFLQFVRVAGDDTFMMKNEASAIINHVAHSDLEKILDNNDASALQSFMDHLHHQIQINNLLRNHILHVAAIYSMPIAATVPNAEERENISEGLGDSIHDALGLTDSDEDKATLGSVKMRLVDLLRSTIFVVKGPNINACFLSFSPIQDGLEDSFAPKGFKVLDRMYGAIRASSNLFVKRVNN